MDRIHLARFVALNAAYHYNLPKYKREEFKAFFVELCEKCPNLVYSNSGDLWRVVETFKLIEGIK
jgi:hypothetical protein